MKFLTLGSIIIATSQLVFSAPTPAPATSTSTSVYLPQFQPKFPDVTNPTDVVTSYNAGPYDNAATFSTSSALKGYYPAVGSVPTADQAEVQAVYQAIDWTKVPAATTGDNDPLCYWTNTQCTQPKVSYLPPDVSKCNNKGEWGLTYDDGPLNYDGTNDADKSYVEPALYNFLLQTNNQKADLFYIGGNVYTNPAAAKRALNNGHILCSHTWSHPQMTTLTNEQVVAELYYSVKVIKEATGVTTKCWRPPMGDVDDRVRAIAWQMGLSTYIWNRDTEDWDIAYDGHEGTHTSAQVDGYFQEWIDGQTSGTLTDGIVVLEHELNHVTINMTEHWLPIVQKTFKVMPASTCNGVTQPYWETSFTYPAST
ncbi:carbohydrate esterase family 4 protein [Backusella circina FSU 941]|nr:carbohydrate esterase family 4 protein [Backusella circina FSU 941]